MRRRTMRNRYSRRAFLASLTIAARAAETTARGRILPSVAVRYADPATEFTVVRLTDPQFTSSLPAIGNRGVTARQLLYASDLDGKWQAYRMDLKSKESRQLTDAENLDAASIALLAERARILAFRWAESGRDVLSRPEAARDLQGSRRLRQVARRQLQRRRPIRRVRREERVEPPPAAAAYAIRRGGDLARIIPGAERSPAAPARYLAVVPQRRRVVEHPFQWEGKPPPAARRRGNAAGTMGCGRSRDRVPEPPGRSSEADRTPGMDAGDRHWAGLQTPRSPTPASSCASTPTRTPVCTWAPAAARLRPIYSC